MNRAEFADFLTRRLTADGFTDVRVAVSRRGEDVVVFDTVDDDWIDELEMLDAIFDD